MQTVASGFDVPVAIAPADDGRLFISEMDGRVWVLETVGPPTLFIDLTDEINGVRRHTRLPHPPVQLV